MTVPRSHPQEGAELAANLGHQFQTTDFASKAVMILSAQLLSDVSS